MSVIPPDSIGAARMTVRTGCDFAPVDTAFTLTSAFVEDDDLDHAHLDDDC